MNTVRAKAVLWLSVLCVAVMGFAACHDTPPAQQARALPQAPVAQPLWTCGMHPQVLETAPGLCAICAMQLTPAHAAASSEVTSAKGIVVIDPVIAQNMGVRVAEVIEGRLTRVVRMAGRVVSLASNQRAIRARARGSVERLHIAGNGSYVERGAPLFDAADGEAPATVSSPISGYVDGLHLVAGSPVEKDELILRVVDLSHVLIEAQAFQHQVPFLRRGQPARCRFNAAPGQRFDGRVASLAPVLDPLSGQAQVQIELDQQSPKLRPGMYGSVEIITVGDEETLLVPREAILDSGTRQLAFVMQGPGRFEPRELRIGAAAEERAQILSGLTKGEMVVVSGQFLLDSESRLQQAIERYRAGTWAPKLKPKPPTH